MTNCATTGICAKKPTTAPDTGPVICGCDNISYWNETLAATFGVSVKGSGACALGTAKTCSAVSDCPNNRFCNYQTTANGSGICAIATSGTCWGLPANCPNVTGGHAKECGQATCETFCEAVKNEKPWFEEQANKCP